MKLLTIVFLFGVCYGQDTMHTNSEFIISEHHGENWDGHRDTVHRKHIWLIDSTTKPGTIIYDMTPTGDSGMMTLPNVKPGLVRSYDNKTGEYKWIELPTVKEPPVKKSLKQWLHDETEEYYWYYDDSVPWKPYYYKPKKKKKEHWKWIADTGNPHSYTVSSYIGDQYTVINGIKTIDTARFKDTVYFSSGPSDSIGISGQVYSATTITTGGHAGSIFVYGNLKYDTNRFEIINDSLVYKRQVSISDKERRKLAIIAACLFVMGGILTIGLYKIILKK